MGKHQDYQSAAELTTLVKVHTTLESRLFTVLTRLLERLRIHDTHCGMLLVSLSLSIHPLDRYH